jgi:MFS family permease
VKKTGKIPKAVIMLGIVSLFTDAASEMIYPLIPVYVAALGSGAIILGIIEGVAETTAAMVKLVSGIISDKTGKRKILVLIATTYRSCIGCMADNYNPYARQGWQRDQNCPEGCSDCCLG